MKKLIVTFLITIAVFMLAGCEMDTIATLDSVMKGDVSWPQEFSGIERSRLNKVWGEPAASDDRTDTWYADGTYVRATYEGDKVVSVNRSETFRAKIVEVEKTQVLVEPVEEEGGPKMTDRIYVPTSSLGEEDVASLAEGAMLEIKCDGMVMETYPAKIRDPYEIRIIDNE